MSRSDREHNDGRPITERRLQRMRDVLARRQPDLTVVLENVHDSHNISAVLRSCEAVGVLAVHLVYTVEEPPRLSTGVSASALKWLDLEHHDSIDACYEELRSRGFSIYATEISERSRDLHEIDLTRPLAIVFGNEKRGCSAEAVEQADGSVMIPMMGMVRSLNISVACAVTLYEAMRQRRHAGAYNHSKLPPEEREERLRDWLQREDRTIDL
jgi:tRNA (guanosine-2'-O-)-methyltransferase